MKLKLLVMSLCVSLSILPLLIGVYYINLNTAQYHRDLMAKQIASLAQIGKRRIEALVNETQNYTAMIANNVGLKTALAGWLNERTQNHLDTLKNTLLDSTQSLKSLDHFTVYNALGNLVITTNSSTAYTHVSLANPFELQTELVPDTSGVQLVHVQPIYFENALIGFIKLAFSTTAINELISDRTGLGKTGEWLFAIQDKNGDAIFAVPLKYDPDAAFHRKVASIREDVPIIQALHGKSIIMNNAPDYREVPVLAATQFIPKLGWGLVVKIDEQEVNYLTFQNQNRVIYYSLMMVIFAIVLALLLAKYIQSPLQLLRDYGHKLRTGEKLPTNSYRGWLEAKELSAEFITMAEKLRHLNEELRDEVSERNQQLQASHLQLAQNAIEDPITGLYNRRYFYKRFDEELDRAKRFNRPLSLAVIEIDQFQMLLEHWGADITDIVLSKVATAMRTITKKADCCGRLSDSEFAILLPEQSRDAIELAMEELKALIFGSSITTIKGTVKISCSIGISFNDDVSVSQSDLLQRAGHALSKAKQLGRNNLAVYRYEESEDTIEGGSHL
ncbi:sensor domain-containing diguanylate cyclase [Pseudoalteromonas xiamenensis]